MAQQLIQLKDASGNLLFPRTLWSLIQGAPAIPSIDLVNSKQNQLTAANAGSNVSITTEGGVLKINANNDYNGLTNRPQINGVTLQGNIDPSVYKLTKVITGGNTTSFYNDQNQVAFSVINGALVTSNFNSTTLTNRVSALESAGYITTANLPKATASQLGVIQVGSHLSATAAGMLSVTPWGDSEMPYSTTHRSSTLSPLDAAWNPFTSPYLFYGNTATGGNLLDIKYTNNSGLTWQDYGWTEAQRRNFLWRSGISNTSSDCIFIKGPSPGSGAVTPEDAAKQALRIELVAIDGIYARLDKLFIRFSTQGSTGVTVKVETLSAQKAATEYTDADWVTKIPSLSLTGYPGYATLNLNISAFGTASPTDTSASAVRRIRLTFYHTSVSSSTGLSIIHILGAGRIQYRTPSTMSRTGHLYSWDGDQNATFPGNITASNIPAPPSANGTYVLTCTRSDDNITYNWTTK